MACKIFCAVACRAAGRGGQEKFVFILNGKIRRHTWWEEGLGGGTRDAREVQATTLFVVDKWMDAATNDRAAAEQQQQQAAASSSREVTWRRGIVGCDRERV